MKELAQAPGPYVWALSQGSVKNNKYALKLQVKQQILNNKLNDKLYRMCDRIGPRHKASMCPMPKALFYILAY